MSRRFNFLPKYRFLDLSGESGCKLVYIDNIAQLVAWLNILAANLTPGFLTQSIGAEDKTGKLIYEGDILQFKDKNNEITLFFLVKVCIIIIYYQMYAHKFILKIT